MIGDVFGLEVDAKGVSLVSVVGGLVNVDLAMRSERRIGVEMIGLVEGSAVSSMTSLQCLRVAPTKRITLTKESNSFTCQSWS